MPYPSASAVVIHYEEALYISSVCTFTFIAAFLVYDLASYCSVLNSSESSSSNSSSSSSNSACLMCLMSNVSNVMRAGED